MTLVFSTPAHESSFLSAASGDTLFWDTLIKMEHGFAMQTLFEATNKSARVPSGQLLPGVELLFGTFPLLFTYKTSTLKIGLSNGCLLMDFRFNSLGGGTNHESPAPA